MICENKTFKLIVRYTKEKGLFTEFKNKLKTLNTPLKNDTKYVLSILRYLGFKEERDEYYMESSKFIFQLYKKEIITEFENLLEINNVKKEYYDNISKDFFIRYIGSSKIKNYRNKKSLVYENLTPQGFIMYGFLWEKTKQGYNFWQTLDKQWGKLFYQLIEKLVNND